ncbi:MAG TPA: response regulator, partial [Polyangiaceae bacterium]
MPSRPDRKNKFERSPMRATIHPATRARTSGQESCVPSHCHAANLSVQMGCDPICARATPTPLAHCDKGWVNMEERARVLVVDDEADSALMMKLVLEGGGHRVVSCASALEALDVIMREDIDVVVTDLSMKELDGIGLCAQVRSARPGTPVIIITAHANLDVAIEAIRAGAYDFVLKPVEA